ncbi:MAG: TonB-dependent siderophore receptor [Acidobacteria bacterium]|nr:TonB-dependent siderophore receptor [Acidobacteriota bacterium]
MAVGTLAATTLGGKSLYAQQDRKGPVAGVASMQTQGMVVRRFDISGGTLEIVLNAYEVATGVQVTIARDSIRSIGSPGVAGLYSNEQALRQLLAGTGITYKFSTPTQVTLQIQGLSTAVEVTATTLPDVMPKYSEALVDTPQTIAVVPQQIIQQQGATTLRDTLRNVAGISLAAGEGGAQGDNLTIRGFAARNDIFLDGMRDFGSYYRDPFMFEEVEVLQGPSSVTFGRGSTGGVVNQVTKSPKVGSSFAAGVNLGSDLTRRVTADWNKPLSGLGEGAAFRLNVMGHDSKVAGRDVAEARRLGVAPSLVFGLGTPTRFKLNYLGEWADDTPDYGIPWFFDHPADVDRSNYYGFRQGNFLKTHVNMGTATLEHDFNASIHVRNQTRYAHYRRDVRITEARVVTGTLPTTPLEDVTLNRNQIAVNSLETFLQNQTDVTFSFRTGFIQHALVTGVEASRETSAPTRFAFTGVPTVSLLDPDEHQAFAGTGTPSSWTHANAVSVGAYALDTLKLGRHWDLTGGLRVDRMDTDYLQATPANLNPTPLSHPVTMTSWRGALVYKPAAGGSIYLSYGNSFNPSAEALSLSAATVSLDPEENRTYEVGTKWDFYSRKLSFRTAAFRTDKLNAREPDPDNPALNVLAGKQRVNGMEVETTGRITSRWQILASYAYLDGKVTSSEYYPLAVGARLANVPKNTFNVWSTYEFPWRLQFGLGSNYVDSRTASSTAPNDPTTGLLKQAPGYVVFNAMARYPLGEHVDLQLNLYNLGDKYYYDQLHPGHIVPGPGRSALVGMNFKF